jgi:hypothetical protein
LLFGADLARDDPLPPSMGANDRFQQRWIRFDGLGLGGSTRRSSPPRRAGVSGWLRITGGRLAAGERVDIVDELS